MPAAASVMDETAAARRTLASVWYPRMRVLRLLTGHRAYFAAVVVTLALAVGANVLVVTLATALWARPRPVHDPDRLVVVMRDLDGGDNFQMSEAGLRRIEVEADFEAIAGQVLTAGDFGAFRPRVSIGSSGREVDVLAVTPNYFRVLGLRITGRDWFGTDDNATEIPAVVISDRLWTAEFDRRPQILGTVVSATPQPLRVIGVAPPGFTGARLGESADVWVPVHAAQCLSSLRRRPALKDPPLFAIARLRPWASLQSTLARLASTSLRSAASLHLVPIGKVFGAPDLRMVAFRDRGTVVVAAATAVLLLVSGCVSLFALVMAHYERRRQELSVRVALGAPRGRLVRHLAGELTIMVAAGASASVAIAALGIRLLPRVMLTDGVDLGRIDLSVDWLVLASALVVAVGTMASAAVQPLLRFSRATITAGLSSSSQTTTPASARMRQTTVVVHICATTIVLVVASVFLRTVAVAFSSGSGFDSRHTLFADVQAIPGYGMNEEEMARERAIGEDVVAEIRRIPGVEAVAYGPAPLGAERAHELGFARPIGIGSADRQQRFGWVSVDENYTSALGVPFLLSTPDRRTVGRHGAILSQTLSKVLSPRTTPIGRELIVGRTAFTVVAVIDVAYGSLKFGRPPAMFTTDFEPLRYSAELPLVVRACLSGSDS